MILKIAFDKQIHLYRGDLTIQRVKKHCETVFKAIPRKFQFFYKDVEGDCININSQSDLDITMEMDQQSSIKKIFIKELDESDSEQPQELNPEEEFSQVTKENFCLLTEHSNYIKTFNLIELRKQEELIREEANKFLYDMEMKIVDTLAREQEQIIKEETLSFLTDVSSQVSQKLIGEQQQIISEEAYKLMQLSIELCTQKIAAAQPCIETEQERIERLVEQKISKLMPNIISQVMKAVEPRAGAGNCTDCRRKSSELELERIISASLLRKCGNKNKQF